jgi:D-threo-aldose 1-dehydrogenase
MQHRAFGRTGLRIPAIVFGTSILGNQYQVLPDETKRAIVRGWFEHVAPPVVVDCAGKYGAGLALEVIGRELEALGVDPERILISNKLGWRRAPLVTDEPAFEPGVWAGLAHDARQDVSREGILRCWEEGLALLGERYAPRLVSVHDPDEYLAAAASEPDRRQRWDDILGAYRALEELKRQGKAAGVGVGSKDWRVIRELSDKVDLDWVMLANSLTVHRHPRELLDFLESLARRGVGVVNSAVFHAGFLVGGEFFDYRRITPDAPENRARFEWRERFNRVCRRHAVEPAVACVQFALSPPAVQGVALNSSRPDRIARNVAAVETLLPQAFWLEMKSEGLIEKGYPYLG